MKKQVLFSLLFSLLTLISADAQTFFTIENNWKVMQKSTVKTGAFGITLVENTIN